jgi:hypothetical protein
MNYNCPKCGGPTTTQGIGYVQGIACSRCNWSAIWCYACNNAPMKVTVPMVNGWLQCPGCGKTTRLTAQLFQWINR